MSNNACMVMSEKCQRVPFDRCFLEANPRRQEHISAESIRDMAESILVHGIKEWMKGRPREDGRVGIWDGQRRWLGFCEARRLVAEEGLVAMAPLDTLPVIVEEITDEAMLFEQMIVFVQRDGLSLRDEVDALARLAASMKANAAQVAARLSKGTDYVADRLQMVSLPDMAWDAYDEGKISQKHLAVIMRLRSREVAEEFTLRVLGGRYGGAVMTYEEAMDLREREFVISLRGCGFDLDDASLVPVRWSGDERVAGGRCRECPHFEMVGKAGQRCHQPGCFDEKTEVMWRALRSNLQERGQRTMDVAECQEHFEPTVNPATKQFDLKLKSPLIMLDRPLSYMDTGNPNEGNQPTWESLLKGTTAGVEAITARHQEGVRKRLYKLLERERAIELAIANDAGNAALFENRPNKPRVKAPKVEEKGEANDQNDGGGDDRTVIVEEVVLEDAQSVQEVASMPDYTAEMLVEDGVALRLLMEPLCVPGHHLPAKLAQAMVQQLASTITEKAMARVLQAIAEHDDANEIVRWDRQARLTMIKQHIGQWPDTAYKAMVAMILAMRMDADGDEVVQSVADFMPVVESAKGRLADDLPRAYWTQQWEKLPKKPGKDEGADALRAWDTERRRILRGAERDGVELKAKG